MTTLREIILEAKDNTDFIYRGCACECYDLVPTLARKLKPETSFKDYSTYADIVETAAKRGYTEVGMSGSTNDLSQHYGLSTSYLDWSYSVDVALYFAFTSYLKQFTDKKIISQNIDHTKICSLRRDFNEHKYCLYKLNKTLYDELKQQYHDLPLIIVDTDKYNERMTAQRGLLSSINGSEVTQETKIRSSQIQILSDWLNSNDSDNQLQKSGNNYLWKGRTLVEKVIFNLPQRDRVHLQKYLKENGAISTKLFPDFEGVRKNIEFSEDYNILRDWSIAYQESAPHSDFISQEDLSKMLRGDQSDIKERLRTDSLTNGEFFPFQK